MAFRRVAGCLLILAACALSALGQGRNTPRNIFIIAGDVRDDSDKHEMENVRVDLKLSSGVPINTTFTHGSGEFEFGNLSNGEYIIEVIEKDYDIYRQDVSLTNSSQRGLSVFLTRPMAAKQTDSRSAISAHELSVPGKAHVEYEKGLQLFYTKSDFRGAIVQFQRAIKDFTAFYEAYAQMGNAYLDLKEVGPAEEAMRKSVDLSSGQYSEAIFMLAGLLNDTNRYPEAATFGRKGMDIDPASWRGPFELARALLGLKQVEDAEKRAAEARDLKPDNPQVYLMLANIHIQRHDYPALQSDLEGYLKLVPTGPQADQARKTRDDLIAARQQSEGQTRTDAAEKPNPAEQAASRANAPPPEPAREMAPPLPEPYPDTSGLTSLPPPADQNH